MGMNRRIFSRILAGITVLLALLLYSCSLGGSAESDSSAEYDYYMEAEEPAAAARGMVSESLADQAALKASPEDIANAGEPGASPEQPVPERKRVYNGSAGLVVDSTEETRVFLEELAVDSGGYVESSYATYVVIRVPVEKFSRVFETVLDLGRLEFSRIETIDVTEAFADLERLLSTARETRERLYVLLERSTDPAERARILREIGRLTEEITSLEQQMELMELRISMSRITVQLIPRTPVNTSKEDIPFRWIAYLDPLTPAGSRIRAKVDLEMGPEWAVFSKDAVYMAENGERSHISISTIENSPRGDADFWGRALAHHLAPYYAEVEEKQIAFGNSVVHGVELTSKDREPFRYFVGIVPDGWNLHVIEIFSPDAEVGLEPVYTAMNRGGLR